MDANNNNQVCVHMDKLIQHRSRYADTLIFLIEQYCRYDTFELIFQFENGGGYHGIYSKDTAIEKIRAVLRSIEL